MDLKETDLVNPKVHWYYQSKLVGCRTLLSRAGLRPEEILDVGAGSGFFSIELAALFQSSTVTCVDPNYTDEFIQNHSIDSFSYKRNIQESSANLVLMIDVLEHVEDDESLLREYVDLAPTGSHFLICVPAFSHLWSGHDEYLEHFRRYTLSQLVDLSNACNLTVIDSHYLFGGLYPLAWLQRKMPSSRQVRSQLKSVPKPINYILKALCSTEHLILRNHLFGVSAVLLASKQ